MRESYTVTNYMIYNKNKIILSVCALLAVFLFFVISYSGGIHSPREITIEKENHKLPANVPGMGSHRLENFTFTEYIKAHNGIQKKFTIQGKKLGAESKWFGFLRIGIAKEMCIKNVKLTFYENNAPVSFLIANRAVSDIPFGKGKGAGTMLAKRIDFSGDVALITEDRRTLTCKRLKWYNADNSILAEGNCSLRYEGKRLKADSIKTDAKLRHFISSKDNEKFRRMRPLSAKKQFFSKGD